MIATNVNLRLPVAGTLPRVPVAVYRSPYFMRPRDCGEGVVTQFNFNLAEFQEGIVLRTMRNSPAS